jgi:hypothetical protein
LTTRINYLDHHPLDHFNLPDDHMLVSLTHHHLDHYLHPPTTTTRHAHHMTTPAT